MVMEVIGLMKNVANNEEVKNDNIATQMANVRSCLETDNETFVSLFVHQQGFYHLQACLRNPNKNNKRLVFEIVPLLFQFESARDFIKGKLDFFTALYQFMDHEDSKMRTLAC